MKNMNNSWRNFLNESSQTENVPFKETRIRIKLENKQKLLREVTEDEFEHIAAAIDELTYDDLAFQKIFGDKSRLVLDFPSFDYTSELGQFINLLQHKFGLDVDWDKGMVSVEREWVDHKNTQKDLVDRLMGGRGSPPKKKKLHMKIGRYLAKVDDLIIQLKEMKEKVAAKVHKGRDMGNIPLWKARVTVGETLENLSDKEHERYAQILNQLEFLTGMSLLTQFSNWIMNDVEQALWKKSEEERREKQDQADIEHDKKPRNRQPIITPETKFVDWGIYWLNNAKYLKENIAGLSSDRYSIIVTRDPIDVWRMSDFENITSCHSPPSRGGGGEYYKCAVAEAHGHGALAYVIETSELLGDTASADLEEAERTINSMGEIFYDNSRRRASDIDLLPISRLRIRKLEYFDDAGQRRDGVEAPVATQLASVERRVYGTQIPGIQERLIKWLREVQQKEMENAPRAGRDGWSSVLNLEKLVQFGGTQNDTPMSMQLQDLFGDLISGTEGYVRQDSETEDELDSELLLGGLIQRYQTECDTITEDYNRKYRSTFVEGTAVDDGGGGVYITCQATLLMWWDDEDFVKMPGVDVISHGLQELEPWGMNWADDKYPYVIQKMNDGRWKLPITVIPEKLVGFDGQEYAYDPDSYEQFCDVVDVEVDDKYNAVEQMLNTFFKREGYMAGGAAMALGREVMNDEMDLYHWEAEVEEGYEPDEIEFVQFTAHPEVWYKDLGASEEQAMQIMNDRIFWLEIRRRMAVPAFAATGGAMYPQMPLDMDLFGIHGTEGESQELNLYFSIHGEDPDEQVNVLKELVNIWDDQGDIDKVVSEVFRDILRKKVGMSGTAVGDLREEFDILRVDKLLERLTEQEEAAAGTQESADDDLNKWLQDNDINRNDVVTEEDTISVKSHKSEIEKYVSQVEATRGGDIQEDVWKKLCTEGIKKPVVVTKGEISNHVVSGANRFIAAQKCGTDIALPIIYVSGKGK